MKYFKKLLINVVPVRKTAALRLITAVCVLAVLTSGMAGLFMPKAADFVPDSTTVTFDGAQTNYYTLGSSIAYADVVDTGDPERGNAIQMKTISDRYTDTARWPSAFRVCNEDGTATFRLKAGNTYNLSYSLRRNTATIGFNLAAILLDSYNGLASGINVVSWGNSNKVKYFNWFDASSNQQWTTASQTFTTTIDSEIAFFLCHYGNGATANQSVWIDDLTIEQVPSGILFESNGGSTVEPVYGNTGDPLSMPPNPERYGYRFAGWYEDNTIFSVPFTDSTIPDGTKTIYAKWDVYTSVPPISNGFEPSETATGFYVDPRVIKMVISDDRAHTGSYSLATNTVHSTEQWSNRFLIQDNGNTFVSEPGAAYQISFWYYIENIDNNADISLYQLSAVNAYNPWDTTKYNRKTVISLTTGSEKGVWRQATVEYAPTSDSTYKSIGIGVVNPSGNSNLKIFFDDILVKKLPPTISFNTNGAEAIDSITGAEGAAIIMPPDPIRYGYRFGGWYRDNDTFTQLFTDSVFGNGSLTIFAKWESYTSVPLITNGFEPSETATGFHDAPRSIRMELSSSKVHSGSYSFVTTEGQGAEQWSNRFLIQDNSNAFCVGDGNVYQISFWYYIETLSSNVEIFLYQLSPGNAYNPWEPANYNRTSAAALTAASEKGKWQKVTVVYNSTVHTYLKGLGLGIVNSSGSNLKIYFDDVSVEKIIPAKQISFESNGGNTISSRKAVVGNEFPVLPIPVKAGQYFEGWYLDAALQTPFNLSVMPDYEIELYASWSTPPTQANSVLQNYEAGGPAYTNQGGTSVSDHLQTISSLWVKNGEEAYEGHGNLRFDISAMLAVESSNKYNAAAVLNSDGTKFKAIAGQRYCVSFAYNINTQSHTIQLVTSQQTPAGGMNASNTTVLKSFNYSSNITDVVNGEWGVYTAYFIPPETGNVYLTIYSGSPTPSQFALLDNLSIKTVTTSECVVITYYNSDGVSKLSTVVGGAGAKLTTQLPPPPKVAGNLFVGWRDSGGKIYTASVFPAGDLNLYASYTPEVELTGQKGGFSSKDLSFEETDLVHGFYNSHHASGAQYGIYPVTDDPAGAHTGSNYLQFEKAMQWTAEYYRRFRFYDPKGEGGMLWLEPNTNYKVSYWMKMESLNYNGNLFLVTFNDSDSTTSYQIEAENYMSMGDVFKVLDKWVKIEHSITTGDEYSTLGLVLYGGYLTMKLDDISVIKLEEVTVSFNSNGGSEVKPITLLSYDKAVQPEPPTKKGMVFDGWYSDSGLKNPFNFNNTSITENITLFAKWRTPEAEPSKNKPENKSDNKPKSKTVYETSFEEIPIINYPEKTELDVQRSVINNDKPAAKPGSASLKEPKQENILFIVLIIAGSVIVLGGAAFGTVLIIKKRINMNAKEDGSDA